MSLGAAALSSSRTRARSTSLAVSPASCRGTQAPIDASTCAVPAPPSTTKDGLVERDWVFWGEWESETRYRTLAAWPEPGYPRYPRYLHEPFWCEPGGKGFRQNTDPYVFGDSFR